MASTEPRGIKRPAAEALPAITGLGPVMSPDDAAYLESDAYKASSGGGGPDCDTPGFDPLIMPDVNAMLGRWVRSPSKFIGWDKYMHFFGMSGDKALQETEEPQEHIILGFSKKEFRMLHRLCWRDGLDCEYTVPIDGSAQPVPPAMVQRASSSWKHNDLMSWEHEWDDGAGNPLHRGLRTKQKLCINGTTYALRYWRSLIRPREMRINVEVTYAETGKYAVHMQRFFRKIDVNHVYSICSLPSNICQTELAARLERAAYLTHAGRGVRLALLLHACNMPRGYKEMDHQALWEAADPFPIAGRDSGPFLTLLREAARQACLWVCCGLVLRAAAGDGKELLRATALIDAEGWLHGIHVDAKPEGGVYAAGTGDWPATQRSRPRGVYDTELGRIAICTSTPDAEALLNYAQMGAEVVLQPPEETLSTNERCGHHVNLMDPSLAVPHKNYTRYELCGPEPWSKESGSVPWTLTHVSDAATVHRIDMKGMFS